MLSDRSYMRDEYSRDSTKVLTWLISAIVAGFALQFVFPRWFSAGDAMEKMLALTVDGIKSGKVWTLFTYSFLHSTGSLLFLHIVSSILGLYFLGRVLEPMLGSRRFAWLYASMVATGGAAWLATHWFTGGGNGPLIGASAGVAGLMVVFACFYPNQPMSMLLFFVLPVTLKPKQLAFAWLAVDLLGFVYYEIMGAASPVGPVAHSAHLGGMLAGWIYFRYIHAANWKLGGGREDVELPTWMRRKKKTAPAANYQVDVSKREDLKAEVDRILDKINSEGFGALTADEKRLLDEARDLLSRR
jgi:membrane associated rhomboid family serine protease